jgi:hypothetical protein
LASDVIGVINAGSSSVKFSVCEQAILTTQVDGTGARPKVTALGHDNEPVSPPELGETPSRTPAGAIAAIRRWSAASLGGRVMRSVFSEAAAEDRKPVSDRTSDGLDLECLSKPLYDPDSMIHRGECPLF